MLKLIRVTHTLYLQLFASSFTLVELGQPAEVHVEESILIFRSKVIKRRYLQR